MQRQITENCNKIIQCVSEPLTKLTELNMSTLQNTLQNWSKNTGFDELTQSKPEDLLPMKFANIAQRETISYLKKASDIWIKAMEQISETCSNAARETTAKTSEAIRSGHKSKE